MLTTIDIEDALRQDIPKALEGAFLIYGAAPPIPEDLGSDLPLVVPYRVGGERYSIVVDVHNVSIDVYASTWSGAMETASQVVAALDYLPRMRGKSASYHSTDISALPYDNPDPSHPDIPRVTVNAQVTTRAVQR